MALSHNPSFPTDVREGTSGAETEIFQPTHQLLSWGLLGQALA